MYHVRVYTSTYSGAGTDGNVQIKIHGDNGVTPAAYLDNPGCDDFEKGR